MIDRLFQIVYLLMEKPQMTAKELAEVFEVSERTIYRDIDKLTIAGIPVYTNPGKHGGISILPGYILDKSVLTTKEKEKIAESLHALNEIAYKEEKEPFSKLRSFLGEDYQDWIEIEFSGWNHSEADAALFGKLKGSILKHCYLEIHYQSSQGTMTKRKIKPLKLCFKAQAWYLYAYCCLRGDYRFFKLKRITEITILNQCFEPEITGKVLQEANREYSNNASVFQVVLEISPDMAFRAYEELTDISVTDNGKLVCTLSVSAAEINWFVSYVLSYGSHIRVLEPLMLKEKVMQEIEKMKLLY